MLVNSVCVLRWELYGTPYDQKFSIWNEPCNLTENDST